MSERTKECESATMPFVRGERNGSFLIAAITGELKCLSFFGTHELFFFFS